MSKLAGGASTPRIEIVDLVKSYRREGGAQITPVNHIDLTVAPDELVVLLGPSGCGKTTLLRCVAGLERPDSGEIVINGRTVFSSRKGIYEAADRRAISMVFQSYALWPHMTVGENVAYPLNSRREPRDTIAGRVSEVLGMVGVGGLEHQYPGRISGGQQQRVALARALVSGSSVVLFDEPLSNVDAQVRAHLRFELQAMQRRLGFAGLYVTHDQTEAMELGHRVAVLDAGIVAALGTPEEVYSFPANEYVASFVGVANIWRATVEAVDGRVALRTAFGLLHADAATTGMARVAPGETVSVVVRPEHIRLGTGAGGGEVTGALSARLFSGAHTEVVCDLRGERAVVWAHDTTPIAGAAPGDPVALAIPPENVRLVPAARTEAA